MCRTDTGARLIGSCCGRVLRAIVRAIITIERYERFAGDAMLAVAGVHRMLGY